MAAHMSRAILGVLLALCAAAASAQPKYPIAVDSVTEPSGASLWADNRGPATVSIALTLPVQENVRPDTPLPMFVVVPPHSRVRIGGLQRTERASWRFTTEWTWRFGAYNAAPKNDVRYRLPWMDGRTFVIGQAPGGRITTHNTAQSRDAVDITMPEGTPIVAARAGTVVHVAGDYTRGGMQPDLRDQANVVMVLHEDGTIAQYAHLMPGGVAVRAGEAVQPGKVLGYSGNTGLSDGPHLHFAVTRIVRDGDSLAEISIPFAFYVGDPPQVFTPKSGMSVRAVYNSRAAAPAQ